MGLNDNSFVLIAKYQKYIEYMLEILNKLPRVEKYNLGNAFKEVMYSMFNNVMYLNKVYKNEKLKYCNLIDAQICIQRAYVRLMYKLKYVSYKQYMYIISMIDEIGKILGGYIKYLGINYVSKDT